ncbi:hypothetical protein EVAR_73207_1 [Eumeta japonica]|uniref:Uncharacterized protein n=1 Tax=Eumeta variegata TaxID=151549 RepID=A0A4C1T9R3_EUMVA|nr:hypothetical protein EVAR_73207_1 [Eumeta japonica]
MSWLEGRRPPGWSFGMLETYGIFLLKTVIRKMAYHFVVLMALSEPAKNKAGIALKPIIELISPAYPLSMPYSSPTSSRTIQHQYLNICSVNTPIHSV